MTDLITMSDALRVRNMMRDQIIAEHLENRFSSHDFIEKYCTICERTYVRWLHSYTGRGNAIQTVHSRIGRFMSVHHRDLNIAETGRSDSECFHGTIDRPMWWRFTDLS